MDFHHDLAEIARKNLKELGIATPANWDDYTTYLKWLQVKQRRFNSSVHYQVQYSKELHEKLDTFSEMERKSVLDIENRLRNAEPITDYMSKQIDSISMKKSDYLLKMWNIYHLHLEKKRKKKKYKNPNLLFFQPKGNTVYFIDIRHHPTGNKWFSKELLEIIYNNWPELLHYKPGLVPCIADGVPIELTDEMVFDLMKAGITSFVTFHEGSVYPTNFGVSNSGDGVNAELVANIVWKNLFFYQMQLLAEQKESGKNSKTEYKLIEKNGLFIAQGKRQKIERVLFREPPI